MESRKPESAPEAADGPTTFNLLFVCSGNTCRSPLAKAIAEHMLDARGWHHVRVDSAGTSAANGAPASANASTVAAENGLDLSAHRSQLLTGGHLKWADVVLAMSPAHVARASELDATARVSLLTDFIDGPGSGAAVRDPFGGDIDAYRGTYRQILAAVAAVLNRLEGILSP